MPETNKYVFLLCCLFVVNCNCEQRQKRRGTNLSICSHANRSSKVGLPIHLRSTYTVAFEAVLNVNPT